MNERLHPEQRIRKKNTFGILHEKGDFVKGHYFNLWAYSGPELLEGEVVKSQKPKIGIIVSRKVSLKATIRNTWKRRIREAFRRMQEQIKEGQAVVIQAKKNEPVPSFKMITEEMTKLLKKTDRLK